MIVHLSFWSFDIFHIGDSNGSDGDGNGDRQRQQRWQLRPVTMVVVVTVADGGDRVVVVPHSSERENTWSSGSFFFLFPPRLASGIFDTADVRSYLHLSRSSLSDRRPRTTFLVQRTREKSAHSKMRHVQRPV